MVTTFSDDVRRASTWSIVLSAMIIAAGVFALIVPSAAGIAVTMVLGWLFLVSGALHVGFAWAAGRARAVVGEILIGMLYGIVGIYLIGNPSLGMQALTAAIAMYLLFEASLEFVLGFQLRGVPDSGWGWLVTDGVVTLLLAALIFSGWPANSVWALGTLAAVSMITSGVTRLIASVAVRRIAA